MKLSWGFFFSPRIFKVIGATAGSALIVETLLKFDFFNQPFFNKCFYLAAQILAVCALYITFLMLMGERSAVNALLGKALKKFKRK